MQTSAELALCECFYSIQGESARAGLPCLFFRLAGCNLRCLWCDSTYSFTGGRPCTVAEAVAWALGHAKYLRMMDLIQMDMIYCSNGGFRIGDCYTGVSYTLEVNGEKHEFSDEYQKS